MTAYETIIVERPAPRIARIVMNRPEARNAQNLQMTYDLNAAFDSAVQDDATKVIILAGSGPHGDRDVSSTVSLNVTPLSVLTARWALYLG